MRVRVVNVLYELHQTIEKVRKGYVQCELYGLEPMAQSQ
jgi:hypothetical protein